MTTITEIHIPPLRTARGKYQCPVCDQSNWSPSWWKTHRVARHVKCECGRYFLESGIKRHRRVSHS